MYPLPGRRCLDAAASHPGHVLMIAPYKTNIIVIAALKATGHVPSRTGGDTNSTCDSYFDAETKAGFEREQ